MTIGVGFQSVLGAAQAGAPWAWSALYGEVAPQIAGFLRLRGVSDPEMATGDVFLELGSELVAFDGSEEQFREIVFGSTLRRLRVEEQHPGRDAHTALSDRALDRHTAGIDGLGDSIPPGVKKVFEVLTPGQRDALSLRMIAGLTPEQTARVLAANGDLTPPGKSGTPDDAKVEALIGAGSSNDPDLIEVSRFLSDLRSLAEQPISQELIDFHAGESARAVTPPVSIDPPVDEKPGRIHALILGAGRKTVATAASFAMLLGATGLAWASDAAGPGDWNYGLDLALEKVGIGAGGAAERLSELETMQNDGTDETDGSGQAQVTDVPSGPDHAAEVVAQAPRHDDDSLLKRAHTVQLLQYLASTGKVDGKIVSDLAKGDHGKPEDPGPPDDRGPPDDKGPSNTSNGQSHSPRP